MLFEVCTVIAEDLVLAVVLGATNLAQAFAVLLRSEVVLQCVILFVDDSMYV